MMMMMMMIVDSLRLIAAFGVKDKMAKQKLLMVTSKWESMMMMVVKME